MNSTGSCLEAQREAAAWIGIPAGMLAAIGNLYCRALHRSISHPVNGKYRCWRCLREFELRW